MSKVDAVVLAGGILKGEMQDTFSCKYKALLPVVGIPMINYIISALLSSSTVDKIIVIGDKENFRFLEEKVYKIIQTKDSLLENVLAGIECATYDNVLIVAADAPLVTGKMIDIFLKQCEAEGVCDFYYPIIRKELIVEKYPASKRTYGRLKDGVFTGGNIALVNKRLFLSNLDLINKVFEKRKSPIALIRILGIMFLLKLVFGILTVEDVEKRASEIVGGLKLKAIKIEFPEIGVDIDKPEDLRLVEEVMGKCKNG